MGQASGIAELRLSTCVDCCSSLGLSSWPNWLTVLWKLQVGLRVRIWTATTATMTRSCSCCAARSCSQSA